MTVVDTNGVVLGLIRTPDAPVFGTDVAVQKARTAAFFSNPNAAALLSVAAAPRAILTRRRRHRRLRRTSTAMRAFLSDPTALANGIAYSNRAIGNLARPFFPGRHRRDCRTGRLSLPIANWSPFNDGLQLDLVFNMMLVALGSPVPAAARVDRACTGDHAAAQTASRFFPGSVPIYRGSQLVGAIGVSGDGIDQDDMVALSRARQRGHERWAAGSPMRRRPMRADTHRRRRASGTRLRYVNCPQAPFNDSSEQNVCAGI